MTHKPPVYDLDVPLPRKGPPVYYDASKAYAVGQEHLALSYVLREMPVGASCLLSNWATTSVNYAQNKHGYKFTRQLQPNGMVRVWRVE